MPLRAFLDLILEHRKGCGLGQESNTRLANSNLSLAIDSSGVSAEIVSTDLWLHSSTRTIQSAHHIVPSCHLVVFISSTLSSLCINIKFVIS
jgi:hypothetical protein